MTDLHEPLKKRSAPKAFEGAVLSITMADALALRQGLGEVCFGEVCLGATGRYSN